MLKQCTRYRVTHDGQEYWHDSPPSEDRLAIIEDFITIRGGHAKVERVTTTIDSDTPWGMGKLHSDTQLIFEIEG